MDGLTCDDFLEAKLQERTDFLNRNLFSLENEHNGILKDFEKYTTLLLRARKTDNYATVKKFISSSRFKDIRKPSDNDAEKENEMNGSNNNPTIKVKTEKLSISSQTVCDDTISMPAPKLPPPKMKRVKKEKFSNIGNMKQESTSEIDVSTNSRRATRANADRTSDVILQNPVIPVVDLIDSSEKEEEVPVRSTRTRTKKQAETAAVRSTRTRTKKTAQTNENEEVVEPTSRTTRTKTKGKRDRSEPECENGVLERKRSKSDSSSPEEETVTNNISSHTEYEDAVSQLENKANETFLISAEKTPDSDQITSNLNSNLLMNETVIVHKSKVHQATVSNVNDIMTDDESVEEPVVTSPQKKAKQDNIKQIFSPYENSPVKKKVEAFEKIQQNENTTTSKMNTSKILKEMGENRGNVKQKAKGFIRSGSTLRTNTPNISKIGKYMGQKTSILNGSRVMTPLSGHNFKDRELKRLENEKEQKKREMLKQAMSEEKKKKYEEKMIRVQQLQKEAKEKEIEKALQIQKTKEERAKLILQQKEEKLRMLKEENDRKRLLVKQRAEEKRKEEEAQKLALQERKDYKRKVETDSTLNNSVEKLPIYMLQPTPRLPCEDCYDSDDDRYHVKEKRIPTWASKSRINAKDYIQTSVGHRIKNTLFCCQSQNINLIDVFKRIDARKLKRTSSANWEKPPRFTLLPPLLND